MNITAHVNSYPSVKKTFVFSFPVNTEKDFILGYMSAMENMYDIYADKPYKTVIKKKTIFILNHFCQDKLKMASGKHIIYSMYLSCYEDGKIVTNKNEYLKGYKLAQLSNLECKPLKNRTNSVYLCGVRDFSNITNYQQLFSSNDLEYDLKDINVEGLYVKVR